jgi:ribosomal protein L31E
MDNCKENENCNKFTNDEKIAEVSEKEHDDDNDENDENNSNHVDDQIENIDDDDDDDELSSDENMCENSSSDADDEDDNDEIVKQLLKQLLTVNKIKKQENAKKDKKFIPSVKKFLKYDMQTKSVKLTPRIVKHLTYLAKMILNNKISIDTDHSDRRLLTHLTTGKITEKDKKVLLIEDYRLHSCFKDAVKVIEDSLKENGRSKKVTSG